MEWYDVKIIVRNQKGMIIWEMLESDFEAMGDLDAKRMMDNKYRPSEKGVYLDG